MPFTSPPYSAVSESRAINKGGFKMRKDFGKKTWFYPLPVLIVGSYDENGKADAMNAA